MKGFVSQQDPSLHYWLREESVVMFFVQKLFQKLDSSSEGALETQLVNGSVHPINSYCAKRI